MDYSKCWLDYQPVDTIEKEWLTYFQSCEGEIVESAVSEYKLAMENMSTPKIWREKFLSQ